MIDLHCHIIPGIDDGAPNLEKSRAMAAAAENDGITVIVATPHVITGVYENEKEEIIRLASELDRVLKEENFSLEILPGAEVRLEPDLPERIQNGEILTLNNTGRYLMVELPAAFVPDYTADVLYQIQLAGITPIIAHPERNAGLMNNHALLSEFVARGTLTQITSASISGYFGGQIRKTALDFIRKGIGHMIATDSHSERGRSFHMTRAFQVVKGYWGIDIADQMTRDIPLAICEGRDIVLPDIKVGGSRVGNGLFYNLASKLGIL